MKAINIVPDPSFCFLVVLLEEIFFKENAHKPIYWFLAPLIFTIANHKTVKDYM